jgi:hypothetical protein
VTEKPKSKTRVTIEELSQLMVVKTDVERTPEAQEKSWDRGISEGLRRGLDAVREKRSAGR